MIPSRRTSDMGVDIGRCIHGIVGITDENCGTSATIVCVELEMKYSRRNKSTRR
jgi:hypothetical protein